MTEKEKPRPEWLDDETVMPPYPILRCPRCKNLFSDHGIHICADLNTAALSSQQRANTGE